MVLRIGKNLIWALIILSLVLAIVLVMLYQQGYLNINEFGFGILYQPPSIEKSIGHWIVLPAKDYRGLTLVVMNNGRTMEREVYLPITLADGYEAINSQNGIDNFGISSSFIIFNLPYSDRNELSDQAITKYRIDKPFKEIYYCEQSLTKNQAIQLITTKQVTTVCQQLNGFLF